MVTFQRSARALVFVSIWATVAVLAGCGSDQPQDVQIQGQLALAGAGHLPDDASARVSLVEHDAGGDKNRIVAERTLHDLGKLPVSFNLKVGSELLGTGGQYGLSAQIMDKGGDVRWQTPVPQAIDPRQQSQPALLMLQANDTGMAGDFQHYRCADDFRFDMANNDKRAVLHMGQRQVSLEAKKSGSAQTAVYADDHGDQLTLGHDKITLNVDGASHMDCQTHSASATTAGGGNQPTGSGSEGQPSDNQMSTVSGGESRSQPSGS
ncbi:YbaY family lipoprotein [Salinisphaera hydrothermalis]|uniref:YbaY family lipoprotein n=1 Tax=Salinisphaera hydrothermalis TaxID=563188 RepID=UPI00333E4DCB